MDAQAGRTVAEYISNHAAAAQQRIVASDKPTPVDAVTMTMVTGAGIAASLIAGALEGEASALEAIEAFDGAISEIAFNAEIIGIERSSE